MLHIHKKREKAFIFVNNWYIWPKELCLSFCYMCRRGFTLDIKNTCGFIYVILILYLSLSLSLLRSLVQTPVWRFWRTSNRENKRTQFKIAKLRYTCKTQTQSLLQGIVAFDFSYPLIFCTQWLWSHLQ